MFFPNVPFIIAMCPFNIDLTIRNFVLIAFIFPFFPYGICGSIIMDVSNFKFSESLAKKRNSIVSESTTTLVDAVEQKKDSGAVNKNSAANSSYSPKQLSNYSVNSDVEKKNVKFDISKSSTVFLKMNDTGLPCSIPPVKKTDLGLLHDDYDGSQEENDEFPDRKLTRRSGKKGMVYRPMQDYIFSETFF